MLELFHFEGDILPGALGHVIVEDPKSSEVVLRRERDVAHHLKQGDQPPWFAWNWGWWGQDRHS